MGAGKGKDTPEASSQAYCYMCCRHGDTGCRELLPALKVRCLPSLPILLSLEGEGRSVEPETQHKAGQGRLNL